MRDLITVEMINEFILWCEEKEIKHRPSRGQYEMVQIQCNSRWHAIYKRSATHAGNKTVHLTIPKPLESMALRFIKDRKVEKKIEYEKEQEAKAERAVAMIDLSQVDVPGVAVPQPQDKPITEDPDWVDDGKAPW